MARTAAAIQTELDAARAARLRILNYGQAKGQDGASKSEVSLKDLQVVIRELEAELSAVANCNAGISFTPTTGM